MTDASYYIAIWIGIGIGIGIGKIVSSVLDIKSIRKKWYQSTFSLYILSICMMQFATMDHDNQIKLLASYIIGD